MVVAERAGNRRASGEILRDKGPDHILLEPLFLVDDVVGDSEVLGHAAGVVDVVERAAAAGLGRIGDAMLAGEAGLIPKLQGEADNLGALIETGEDCRNRRRVDSSGHGDGNGLVLGHGDSFQVYFRINCIGVSFQLLVWSLVLRADSLHLSVEAFEGSWAEALAGTHRSLCKYLVVIRIQVDFGSAKLPGPKGLQSPRALFQQPEGCCSLRIRYPRSIALFSATCAAVKRVIKGDMCGSWTA